MNTKYDPSGLIQVYYKALQDARTILVALSETVSDKVLIRQGIDQFNHHMDLNEAVDEWKKKPTIDKTWKIFKTHFSKAVTRNQKRSGTLKEIGIANQVKEQLETNRDNTETIAQFQVEQAQTIDALQARLALLEAPKGQAYGAQGPPSVIKSPSTPEEMSQLTTILQGCHGRTGTTSQQLQHRRNKNGTQRRTSMDDKRQRPSQRPTLETSPPHQHHILLFLWIRPPCQARQQNLQMKKGRSQ
jgi:hypothetical protein